ncbi:uncharacterized protein [Triticum aestivum]|uniref:uncharacterized protein n=1 Tax=Triticum aestivum TaxID=4565 RepID=UPI001D007AEA|nr:uncharacterized protein LOC123124536 [Triticum aestivum]
MLIKKRFMGERSGDRQGDTQVRSMAAATFTAAAGERRKERCKLGGHLDEVWCISKRREREILKRSQDQEGCMQRFRERAMVMVRSDLDLKLLKREGELKNGPMRRLVIASSTGSLAPMDLENMAGQSTSTGQAEQPGLGEASPSKEGEQMASASSLVEKGKAMVGGRMVCF